MIRPEVEALARDLRAADGCVGVYSPVLGKRALFERSGHWAKFSDDMFPPMPVGGDELVLRPANCPHHALIYAASGTPTASCRSGCTSSGAMFRAERSGVLSGLGRVRQITPRRHPRLLPPRPGGATRRRGRCARCCAPRRCWACPIDHVRLSRRGDGAGYLGDAEAW